MKNKNSTLVLSVAAILLVSFAAENTSAQHRVELDGRGRATGIDKMRIDQVLTDDLNGSFAGPAAKIVFDSLTGAKISKFPEGSTRTGKGIECVRYVTLVGGRAVDNNVCSFSVESDGRFSPDLLAVILPIVPVGDVRSENGSGVSKVIAERIATGAPINVSFSDAAAKVFFNTLKNVKETTILGFTSTVITREADSVICTDTTDFKTQYMKPEFKCAFSVDSRGEISNRIYLGTM